MNEIVLVSALLIALSALLVCIAALRQASACMKRVVRLEYELNRLTHWRVDDGR